MVVLLIFQEYNFIDTEESDFISEGLSRFSWGFVEAQYSDTVANPCTCGCEKSCFCRDQHRIFNLAGKPTSLKI